MTRMIIDRLIDASAISGAAMIWWGGWHIHYSLAWIVPGAVLISASVLGAKRWAS